MSRLTYLVIVTLLVLATDAMAVMDAGEGQPAKADDDNPSGVNEDNIAINVSCRGPPKS